MEGNNVSGTAAHIRDVFLDAEKDYLEKLKTYPEVKDLIESLNKKSGTELAKIALEKIEAVEYGQVGEDQIDKTEFEITVLLAAIQDIQRERTLERTKSHHINDDFQK